MEAGDENVGAVDRRRCCCEQEVQRVAASLSENKQGTSLEPEVRKPLPCELPTATSAQTPCWSCLRPLSPPLVAAEGGEIVVAATNHDPAPMPPPAAVAVEIRNGRGGLPRCSLASPGLHQHYTLLPLGRTEEDGGDETRRCSASFLRRSDSATTTRREMEAGDENVGAVDRRRCCCEQEVQRVAASLSENKVAGDTLAA
nr:hypothetical protein Itr_chr02CG14460 [Ipomoea trifida]